MRRVPLLFAVLALIAACSSGDDGAAPATTTTTSSTTTTTTTTSTTTTTTAAPTTSTTTTTTLPAPICDVAEVVPEVDAVIADARLSPTAAWSPASADAAFVAETAEPTGWAGVLGLDCGATLAPEDGSDRLVLIAWTGPRMAFVIRTTDVPDPPPATEVLVTVGFEDPKGEFVRADTSVWVASLSTGETLVVGHIDFNLGIAAKSFTADAPPFGEAETVIRAEEVGIAILETVGARNVGVAQPPEFGSEEGYVMFVSPAGQILVVDVAPDGWFDPMQPRYYTGETRTLDVDGVTVRITEPAEGEDLYTTGVEVAWACAGHVWILEPGGNGGGEEMVAFVAEMLQSIDCTNAGAST